MLLIVVITSVNCRQFYAIRKNTLSFQILVLLFWLSLGLVVGPNKNGRAYLVS